MGRGGCMEHLAEATALRGTEGPAAGQPSYQVGGWGPAQRETPSQAPGESHTQGAIVKRHSDMQSPGRGKKRKEEKKQGLKHL